MVGSRSTVGWVLVALTVLVLSVPTGFARPASAPIPRAVEPTAPIARPVAGPPPPSTPAVGPWVNLTHPTSPAPSERSSPSMAYDPLLGGVVLYGGYNVSTTNADNDTWEFANGNWTDLTTSLGRAPPGVWGGGLAYDPSLGGMVLFGGRDYLYFYNETWLLNSTGWWNIGSAVAPYPRLEPALSYDPTDHYLVLFSGYEYGGAVPNDTWELNGTGWHSISPKGSVAPPVGSTYDAGAWDAHDGYFLVYGGSSSCAAPYTWTYVGGAWTNRTASSGAPPAIYGGSFQTTYDPDLSAVVTFGGMYSGSNCGVYSNVTWEYSGGRWTNLSAALPVAPLPLCCGGFAFDPVAQGDVLFGGNGNLGNPPRLNYTWLLESDRVHLTATPDPADALRPVVLNATEVGLTGPFNWSWTFGDGNSSANAGANLTHRYAAAGVYNVTVNVTDGNGSSFSASVSLTVNPALAAAPTVTPSAGDSPVVVHLDANPSGGTGPNAYLWNLSNGVTLTSASSTTTLSTTGNYTIAFRVSDSVGSARFANFSVEVFGSFALVSQLTPRVGIVPFTVRGTGSISGGDPPTGVQWDFGAGPGSVSATSNASYNYTVPGQYHVEFSGHDALGVNRSDNYTVNAFNPLQAFANASNPVGVAPFTPEFSASAVGGGGTYTYAWNFGDGITNGTGVAVDQTYDVVGNYTVTVSAKDQYGFGANASLRIQVVAPLTATLAPTTAEGASPFAVDFVAHPSGGYGNETVFWVFGDGAAVTGGLTVSHTYTVYGVYAVRGTVNDALGDHASVAATITVVQPLAARLVIEPGNSVAGTSEVFTVTPSFGLAPYRFLWSGLPPGCALGNVSTGSCNSTVAGSYTISVEVTDALGEHLNDSGPLVLGSIPVTSSPSGGGSSGYPTVAVVAGVAVLVVAIAVAVLFSRRRGPPAAPSAPETTEP